MQPLRTLRLRQASGATHLAAAILVQKGYVEGPPVHARCPSRKRVSAESSDRRGTEASIAPRLTSCCCCCRRRPSHSDQPEDQPPASTFTHAFRVTSRPLSEKRWIDVTVVMTGNLSPVHLYALPTAMRDYLSSRDRCCDLRAQAAGWCGRPLNPEGRSERLQSGEDVCGDGAKDAQAHALWSRRRAIHDTVESLGLKPLTDLLEHRPLLPPRYRVRQAQLCKSTIPP